MSEQYDPFEPSRLDESVEQLSSIDHAHSEFSQQKLSDPGTRLIRDLQSLYGSEYRSYQQAMRRVENRLLEHYSARKEQSPTLVPSPSATRLFVEKRARPERKVSMEDKHSLSPMIPKARRSVGILVAIAALVILIGGLFLVQNYRQQQLTREGSGRESVVTATPPKATPASRKVSNIGKTLYTSVGNKVGFNGLAWSPDSTRVASSTIEGAQIWDATSGKHLVNVQFDNPEAFPNGLAWSPDSQLLAIASSQALFIVNGQTGAIVQTLQAQGTGIAYQGGSKIYHTSLRPTGSGEGFRSVAWSHDGNFIAASVSAGSGGYIEILNAKTFELAYTFNLNNNYVPTTLAWSGDGRYLAANVFSSEPGNQTVSQNKQVMIWAWNIPARQIVFQKPGGTGSDSPLEFQPASHNLAFVSAIQTSSIEVWNVGTAKLVTQYKAASSGPLAWSPDGQWLAYAQSSQVKILDSKSGQTLYTYEGHKANVCQLAWSPNGNYIVSGEGQTEAKEMVAKVWTAG
ncbi:hypothetical protein EPA93_09120 [Ktedonosporobacter rubrisoli]|uniref:Uncharacterized protein n=1 Tax=Ktedonosporobacter rubrisoli TaxID=2509675 RepID=A0A4P6JM88_KTERU|nr:PD40 domain-containing protein [Ktedonosporobacter rubrisoli]QBD76160.1 hypothetical protein EPA93_09120 [Ktedonosporobacter rubrisoli]